MFKSYCKWFDFMPMLAAEGGSGGNSEPTKADPSSTDSNNLDTSSNVEPTKTFTQEDLNRIAAQEKRQGVSSILKALGFEKEEDAKAFVEKYRTEENNKKDDLTKANDALNDAKKAKEEAERKADAIEKKLKVVSMGVPAEKAGDIVVLATSKAIDGKSFDDALEELKKSYPALFEGTPAGGTGNAGNPPRGKGNNPNNSSIGKRLAEQKKTSGAQSNKNSYFSN